MDLQARQTLPAESLQSPLALELARLREENSMLKSSLERLEGLAYRDALTGLRNRRYFDERLDEEVARLRRTGAEALSVILVDLDGFKNINDARGHAAGDQALTWISEFLRAHVRFTDACCRMGGDEFVLLLPETGAEGCAIVAALLRRRIDERLAAGEAPVGFSLGCATSRRSEEPCELIARADSAMYIDKRERARPPMRIASFAA